MLVWTRYLPGSTSIRTSDDRARSVRRVLPGIELRICLPEDLIVMKCFASRPQDWQDVASVIVRQGVDKLDWNYVESNLGPLVALKEAPEIMDRVAALRKANRS